MSFWEKTKLSDEAGNTVGVQYPLSIDGDSVYEKDIDTTGSSVGTFTGTIASLFNDLGTTFSSTGHVSPANFTIKLNRPITNTGIKFCSPSGKNFSNVKITLRDASGATVAIIDDSSNSTDYTSNEYFWEQSTYCTIFVEFYTTDDIDLNFAILEKSILVHESIKFLDPDNSTTTPLGISGTFTGTWSSVTDYSQAIIVVVTDENSAADGLKIDTSEDGSTVDHTHVFSPLANDPYGHHYASTLESKYMRVRYTNGVAAQTIFKLKTTFFRNAVEAGHVHGLDFAIEDDHPAPIVRSINTAKNPAGSYINIEATTGGNLKVAVEEYDDTVNPVRSDLEGVGDITVGVAQVEIAITGTPTYSIRIQADVANTGIIYIGETGVLSDGSNDFVRLYAGDEVTIDYDDASNALYAIASVAAQKINVGALL
jgi:hypothetical protein